jgi:hypothetical protein
MVENDGDGENSIRAASQSQAFIGRDEVLFDLLHI